MAVTSFSSMNFSLSISTKTCLDKCAKLVDAILLRASAFLFLLCATYVPRTWFATNLESTLTYTLRTPICVAVNSVPSGLVSIKPAPDPSTHEDPSVNSVSAVYLSCNPVQHQRTKHIEIDIHFVRDLVIPRKVRVLHVPSRYQFADIFTKGLSSALFEEFRSSLSVQCPPAQTAGKC
ncbi:ribonuclease H-like domain-containing protein [Tanacetum coccineum]